MAAMADNVRPTIKSVAPRSRNVARTLPQKQPAALSQFPDPVMPEPWPATNLQPGSARSAVDHQFPGGLHILQGFSADGTWPRFAKFPVSPQACEAGIGTPDNDCRSDSHDGVERPKPMRARRCTPDRNDCPGQAPDSLHPAGEPRPTGAKRKTRWHLGFQF